MFIIKYNYYKISNFLIYYFKLFYNNYNFYILIHNAIHYTKNQKISNLLDIKLNNSNPISANNSRITVINPQFN